MNATVTNKNGKQVDFDSAVNLMDDDIREELHASLAPTTPQAFFTAYEEAHYQKFGNDWELSKRNPIW